MHMNELHEHWREKSAKNESNNFLKVHEKWTVAQVHEARVLERMTSKSS